MFEKLMGGGSDIKGIIITRVANGFIVDLPNGSDNTFGEIIKDAMRVQEEMADPIMANIKSDGDEKIDKTPNSYVFGSFKEVLKFLDYYYSN